MQLDFVRCYYSAYVLLSLLVLLFYYFYHFSFEIFLFSCNRLFIYFQYFHEIFLVLGVLFVLSLLYTISFVIPLKYL